MPSEHDIAAQFRRGVHKAADAGAGYPAFLFEPFDTGIIGLMIAGLPHLSEYCAMPHPDSLVDQRATRWAIPLNQHRAPSPFWLAVAGALRSDGVRQAIATALNLSPADMHPAVALVRDLAGYKINPHPDSAHKLATAQIYLASHANAPHIGVRFYRHAIGDFIETGAVPYLPGSGYFFRRTDASWHGVDATTEKDGVRDSLMLVYFDSPKVGFN